MNTDAQRIAIAEVCGWKWYRIPPHNLADQYRGLFLPSLLEYEGQSDIWKVRADGTEKRCSMGYMAREGYLPDYLNDLNAMHDAEETIVDPNAKLDYVRRLMGIVDAGKNYFPAITDFSTVSAKAAHRAEAFLRHLNLWKSE